MVAIDNGDEAECHFPPFVPPTFPTDDLVSATEYLREHGFCVFQDVASKDDVEEFLDLLRSDFGDANPAIPKEMGLDDFTENMIATSDKGLSTFYTHGRASWAVRLHPPVRKVFQHVLGVEENQLVSSFDVAALSIHGARHGTNQWWGHVDQSKYANANGDKLPCADITSFQSSLYLTDSTRDDSASFVAVPGSHLGKHWDDLAEEHLKRGNFCCPRCSSQHWMPADRARWEDKAVKLRIPRGSLLVWNSKLVHQSSAATVDTGRRTGFARIAFMVGYGRAADRTDGAERKMLAMLLTGRSSNSWPQLAQERSDDHELDASGCIRRLRPELKSGLQQQQIEQLLPPPLQGRGLGLADLARLSLEEASLLSVSALRQLLPHRLLVAIPLSANH